MSSHTIVRECQEPALIIANGEACHDELLYQLLEWSPLVLVLDGAIHRVLDKNIKIDVFLGDFDQNIEAEQLLTLQPNIKIVHAPNQDKTDLEKAIEYLIENGHHAANIIWATGRRADHSMANMANLVRYKDQIKLVMLDNHSKIFPINHTYEKWYEKSTPISLLPIGQCNGITTSGLKYNLDNDSLRLGFRMGNSNEALSDGFVKITINQGELLLMECWD